ncbi:MAG: hypothetical protein EAZ30_04275 [Betaproteobacteria bacterium]|nr:MAG: hypothetical protein EAZ30_04275 [Betaproteobacteria bacterium]
MMRSFDAQTAHTESGLPIVSGKFVDEDGETWYRIDSYDQMPPFFMALAGDSDLWAYVSTAGSLAAGRRDAEGSFFPYETVDKIHLRGEHTGPGTWIHAQLHGRWELWQPFSQQLTDAPMKRSVWKNLTSTRIRFREEHPSGRLAFQYEWFTVAQLGLVRAACIEALGAPVQVKVLDGVLNLIPPGIGVELSSRMSCLTDAYKWSESTLAGRLGIFTIYAQIWDRAEPKECLNALTVWHSGLPANTRTLLSSPQVANFCRHGTVEAETLTRGRRGAYLTEFEAEIGTAGLTWHLVIDGPKSQVQVFELASSLAKGGGSPEAILEGRDQNTAGLRELLRCADAFQSSGNAMAAAHHQANVLFNIMRGGVFANGTQFARDDLLKHISRRHRALGAAMSQSLSLWPATVDRAFAIDAAMGWSAHAERLVLEYLPITFSRRHGDPSRPWNKFSIRVRDSHGHRIVNYEGNWRDIFQNWEALAASAPEYLGSMIAVFVNAMTVDGYNPYRISRDGIDWEVDEPGNAWSHIGYWGDHQIIYLLRLLEAAQCYEPTLIASYWDRPVFSFSDVPYRLKPHIEQLAQPKSTLIFDHQAHAAALARADRIGSDGLLVCNDQDEPVLGTLAEKLATILLAKASSLVPGGGLWLHTQRPEWNDANNALVGNGLSVVTLAHLRRFLVFLDALPCAEQSFTLPSATLTALNQFQTLVRTTRLSAVDSEIERREYLDGAGRLIDAWHEQVYRGAAGRTMVRAPQGLLHSLVHDLLPLIDATLEHGKRSDGLYDSYNLVEFNGDTAAVGRMYPMLEGQVALLSSGFLSLAEAIDLLDALFKSPLYCSRRKTFLLYPDRSLPSFLERNRLDEQAVFNPLVKRLLEAGRSDVLQAQSDGTIRFAPEIANRSDLEAIASDLGSDLPELVSIYERVLKHREFTGRSGTMFGYEGLGCVYWHMVAKLLLAVQERVFEAADSGAPELARLCNFYRRVRDGIGYRKSVLEYGAFPADPYSHTASEGGAQQPGMTGQVKEEILTRWGELGLRMNAGRVYFNPVLLDAGEIPVGGSLTFSFGGTPYSYERADITALYVLGEQGWQACPDHSFDPRSAKAVRAEVALGLTQ